MSKLITFVIVFISSATFASDIPHAACNGEECIKEETLELEDLENDRKPSSLFETALKMSCERGSETACHTLDVNMASVE